MNIDIDDLIARYQQELAQMTHRAIIAEAGFAAAQKRIAELEAEAATAREEADAAISALDAERGA